MRVTAYRTELSSDSVITGYEETWDFGEGMDFERAYAIVSSDLGYCYYDCCRAEERQAMRFLVESSQGDSRAYEIGETPAECRYPELEGRG